MLLTCFVSRAVDIETTKSMETDSFILTLRRFIARRGNVRTIRSDNGSNFVGAERELAKSMEINLSKIQRFMLNGLLTSLGLLELWHLIYSWLLTGFGMLVFFTNLCLKEFQVRKLALFLLFSVIDVWEWFWMGSLHSNIQLILEFLKAAFLALLFSYYTLKTLII